VSVKAEREFRPATRRAKTVIVLLAAYVLVELLLIWVSLGEIGLVDRVQRGALVPDSELIRSDERSAAVGGTSIVMLLVTGIAWLVWQHRSQANLHARRVPGLTYTPGWAVGWWFVPFVNLVKPYQTVRELWAASGGAEGWVRGRTWPVLGWWWAAWILSNITGQISLSLVGDQPDIGRLIASDRWAIASSAISIVAAVLAILIVRSVDRRQARLDAPPAFSPPPLPPPPPPPVP
jgi:Domain of unknown function (DUF4328)